MAAETPAKKAKTTKTDQLEVVCRITPYHGENACVDLVGDDQLRLVPPPDQLLNRRNEPRKDVIYKFSHVFEGIETQRAVFDRCGFDLVEDLLHGKNSLLFTYGVTGSGKTFTMTGDSTGDRSGIIPRCVDVLFNSITNQMPKCVFQPNKFNGFTVRSEREAEFERAALPPSKYVVYDRVMESKKVFGCKYPDWACSVFVSYVEIYNDTCYDLLDDGDLRQSKLIRTDAKGINYVEGVREVEVSNSDEVVEQHLKAQERRKQAATMLNATSSRSHSIFNIRLVRAPLRDDTVFYPDNDPSRVVISQLSLVDLAGSERSKRTENRGERLMETGKINQSLSVLRKCFDQLRENQRRGLAVSTVSYREQKLTYLFKSYFEGHGKIRMVVCLNARPSDFEENVFVVSFAEKAQTLGVPEATVPAPLLCDMTDQNYTRRKVNAWYREWERDMAQLPSAAAGDFEPPQIELSGPDDVEAILRLREYYTTSLYARNTNKTTVENRDSDFNRLLLERLCAADLDRARLEELEMEVAELREYNTASNKEINRLRRDNNSLLTKLGRYESRVENERYRDAGERRAAAEQAQAFARQREALQKVALVLNDPSSPTVAELRKKFSTAAAGLFATDETESSSSGERGTSAARRVREYIGGGRGLVYNAQPSGPSQTPDRGFANRRYYRRSRSAGGRVLNHEPVARIPNGTIFQQQYPKNAKHTTQPNHIDFSKCTDYVVTQQDVDMNGKLSTQCIKGEIVPTAGGGHAVMFKDVERLTQASP